MRTYYPNITPGPSILSPLSTSPLENYGSVLRDCATALSANHKCNKAYYRSSIALLALERAKEALDCCDRCLAIDPENIGIKGVKERARNLKEKQDQKAAVEEERKKQEEQKQKALSAALKVREICDALYLDGNSRSSWTNSALL